jgi:UDP-glucose 4-epimerase
MNVLVTGGTGFIGRRLVQRLIADYGAASIVCLTKSPVTPLEAKAIESFRGLGVRMIEGNLLDAPVSGQPPPPMDVVFHLAANIDTDAPEEALRVNHEGTRHLLDWLRPVSRGARIVYASSVAVHDRDRAPAAPISETSPFVPRTAYGRTKLQGERIIAERAAADGYSWTTVRLPTVYGPGQKPDGLFDTFITLAATGGLVGRIDWPGRTSIIHVDDVAAVMIELAANPETAGEVYCLASDEDLTVGELSRRIGTFVGHPVSPVTIPRPLLAVIRSIAWNRAIAAAMPARGRLPFWRFLSPATRLLVHTSKFRRFIESRSEARGGLV